MIEKTRGIFEAKGRLVRNLNSIMSIYLVFWFNNVRVLKNIPVFTIFASNILP